MDGANNGDRTDSNKRSRSIIRGRTSSGEAKQESRSIFRRQKRPVMRSREPGGASPGGEPALLEILNTSSCSSTQNEARANPSLSSVPASCTLCLVVSNSVVRGLKSFFAEFVNDPKSRVVFRASRGFCRGHVPLLYSTGDPLGIAILYADLADATLIRWNGASPTKRGALISRSAARLAPCPACTLELEANSRYSGALAMQRLERRIGLELC